MNTPTQSIFRSVLLRPPFPDRAGLAHLEWSGDEFDDRAVQVYLDGRVHDVALRPGQRSTWLHLPRDRAAGVELLAVPLEAAWEDYAHLLAGWTPPFTTEAQLAVIRDESLPVDARAIVRVDGEDRANAPLWGGREPRHGFGGLFGIGAFGHGLTAGPGVGLGEFGLGAFGGDGSAWRWADDALPPGDHTLDLRVEDAAGRSVAELASPQNVTIDAIPGPADDLALDEDFLLIWS